MEYQHFLMCACVWARVSMCACVFVCVCNVCVCVCAVFAYLRVYLVKHNDTS